MAVNLRLNNISLGILLLTLYIAEIEGKALLPPEQITQITNGNEDYSQYLRQVLMDAGHIIDNLFQKGKKRLMDLPHEGWLL